MRKVGAAFLLVLFVGTATDLPQLAKLPLLVIHFIDHVGRDNLTVAAFFAEHYLHDDIYDADRAQDLQLPFKVELPGAFLLMAASMMRAFGVSGNLMSLGAIDFGLLVDGAVSSSKAPSTDSRYSCGNPAQHRWQSLMSSSRVHRV